ncbi:MAG TPA: wax ester/triacylglycerol synthase family O-acyltransferase [Solirubrobacteraceae bacterium]
MGTQHAMSHADAAWLQMDRPTNLMVITSALWFDAPIDEQRLRDIVQERLVDPFPRFAQRVAGGVTGPAWEDDPEFALDLHIHHLALAAPGDQATLQTVVGDLMAQPLDHARPLWAMYLLDGYGDGCAIVVRMHHAIADGIALARVMLSLTDDLGDGEALEIADDAEAGGDGPGALGRIVAPLRSGAAAGRAVAGAGVHAAVETVLHPRSVADVARQGGPYGVALLRLLSAPAEPRSALHGPLGATRRAAWSRPLPLGEVRRVGHLRGATVNDMLVAGVTGAVRSYLLAHDGAAQDTAAMVPFNLRPLDEPLPRDLGNRFGLVVLRLPAAIEDAAARLDEVAARMLALKRSRQGEVSYGILDAIGRMPSAVEARIVDLMAAKAIMVLTNVPGPRAPIALAGVPVAGVLVWAPCSGSVGMSVSVFSYDGRVTVGFMTDGTLVPEPAELVDAFENELAAMGVPAVQAS